MAYSRTLAELELAVRREADMVNSQFVTSAEVREYINQSWAELYDRIVLFDQEYLLKYVDISSNAASSDGDLDVLYDGSTGVVKSILSYAGGTGYVTGEANLVDGTNSSCKVNLVASGGGTILSMTLSSGGSGYKPTSITATTASLVVNQLGNTTSTATVFMESDFYKCKGVWIGNTSSSSAGWNPLRRFQWDQQNALRQEDTYGSLVALPFYRVYTLMGREKVGIAPMVGGTYRVWYYPAPYKMLSDTDRIDGRSGWDEWVIKDTAIKCLLKEESIEQAAAIKAVRDELFQRFQLHASERDASQPEKIRNVNLLSRRYTPWR